jgi:hypothetical protein
MGAALKGAQAVHAVGRLGSADADADAKGR